MADRPILFSGPMVRALLDGRKTQTRRVLKSQPFADGYFDGDIACDFIPAPASNLTAYARFSVPAVGGGAIRTEAWTPRYAEGDRLWVREAWARVGDTEDDIHACPDLRIHAYYRADTADPERQKWRSPIHMPRWASRLTLTVTDVRVQRLQDISEEDARAEGATYRLECSGFMNRDIGWSMDWSKVGQPSRFARDGKRLAESDISLGSAVSAFASFINELHDPRWNHKGDGLFGANPWVATYTFAVERRNIDATEAAAP